MDTRSAALDLLAHAGRLLLEYNESTGEIHRALTATSLALTGEKCEIAVSYSGVAVALAGEGPILMPVREIRYNSAVQSQIHAILAQVRRSEVAPAAAVARLEDAEATTPRHAPWIVTIALAAGAAALAALLGADAGAAITASLATALGFVARQTLHRRHFSLLTLPLTAAFIAGVVGGLAIRLDWSRSPGLALIVPCLMLVPGPHLINGLLDLIDNYLPMSLARLGLAAGILMASSLGLLAGVEVTLAALPEMERSFKNDQLNLVADMILAGVVTCGFAAYYNAAWPQLGLAVLGGAFGHGMRFLALEAGCTLEAASFVGGFAVGVVSAWIARRNKSPMAPIAFAGAVTMMPGLQLYSAFRSARQLVRVHAASEFSTIAETLTYTVQAAVVVALLGLGLIVAIRTVHLLTSDRRHSENHYLLS
jgi:uncharacterized membrane protein YjjP (DUF1212 family)